MYIAYHSVKVMGGDLELDTEEISFFSRKSESFLEKALDDFALVIVGMPDKKGKIRYFAEAVFEIAKLDYEAGDIFKISGPKIGDFYDEAQGGAYDCTEEEWFIRLKKEQNNFSFGFNRIKDNTADFIKTSIGWEELEL
jgi:hypothetical protein